MFIITIKKTVRKVKGWELDTTQQCGNSDQMYRIMALAMVMTDIEASRYSAGMFIFKLTSFTLFVKKLSRFYLIFPSKQVFC